MTAPKQQTLAAEAEVEGIGLHTGSPARVRFRPAPAGSGIRFRRVDIAGEPEIPADLDHVASTDRGTSLKAGEAVVHTVEHVLAAVAALEIDNLWIDVSGPEVPVGDGSFRPFFDVLARAGTETQDADARVIALDRAVTAEVKSGASYVAAPASTYRISATIDFPHPVVGRQYASFDVTPEAFERELAGARTFGFLKEAEALRARGLALGASLENAVVLDDESVVSGELRYPDEFVRHKIGDVVGDLALLGARLAAHVVADRPSHEGNLALAREIRAAGKRQGQPIVDIEKIMQYLPHRYPMLLVDRILEFESGKRIVGIKNVTINEPFFQGHYPGHPVMPGVLVIEAMAQVGGLLLMEAVEDVENKTIYFMALDNVKWRRPITPGDQIRFELEMLQLRRHVCRMRGVGYVDGQVAVEAEMMAGIRDR
ncbi:MAG: UDP-3-O-acyl-N-acetylglucosamine deacetylase [Gemmatimonadota bacterium]|jgi:UDP-3-O-[3-hydroxymyristoyl] N-acetylglucosamine deacetylase/3-hydroxyacyl-[acyl-carrier-protein] dehydratase